MGSSVLLVAMGAQPTNMGTAQSAVCVKTPQGLAFVISAAWPNLCSTTRRAEVRIAIATGGLSAG